MPSFFDYSNFGGCYGMLSGKASVGKYFDPSQCYSVLTPDYEIVTNLLSVRQNNHS
jgi:hypothetical protein